MAVPANKENAVSELVNLHHRAQRNDRDTFGIHHPIGLFLVLNGIAGVLSLMISCREFSTINY